MKRRIWMAMVMAGCMAAMSPMAVYGAETTEEAPAAEPSEATQAEGTSGAGEEALSDDIYSFQLDIDGTKYQFPMSYSDFTAQGWELSKYDDPEMKVGTNSYGMVGFLKGDTSIRADVINFGINEVPLSECLVGGITIDGSFSDVDLSKTIVTLPKGIVMGKATLDEVKAAYGEPSDTYEGDNYTKLTYEKEIYQDVELYIYKEGGTLKQVSFRNFSVPEDFDKGSVSTEVPEIVTAYQAPEAPSETFMEPVVEYFGDLYQLPAPVSAFEENGWVLLDVSEDAYVEGRGIEFIEMMKENQTVRFSIYNLTENAVAVRNCFVEDLEHATYDPEIISMKLSGGIALGAEKSDLIALAEQNGYTYEDDTEDGYLTIYKNKETKLEHNLTVWFDKEKSETAAAHLTMHNEVLPE